MFCEYNMINEHGSFRLVKHLSSYTAVFYFCLRVTRPILPGFVAESLRCMHG